MNLLRIWLGKLICKWRGHKRGVRVPRNELANQEWQTFRCGRCGATWTRKARKEKP